MQVWDGFKKGRWQTEIDVRSFIQSNFSPYQGDASFLHGPSERTRRLWQACQQLLQKEYRQGGVLDIDADTPITITSHAPGYIDREAEIIVGLQTDQALKRAIQVYGGLRTSITACEAYGYHFNPHMAGFFRQYLRTHNEGVFSAYTPEMRKARQVGIITGLPDAYGRGRIIGDYRRVPLYGVDRLIQAKRDDLTALSTSMDDDSIRLREELFDQIQALQDMKTMANSYGFDISAAAGTAQEAVQWLYFAYLAAVKEQNGAAMSLGRVSTFLDIYLQRDLDRGLIGEAQAQELIDQLVIKLRLVRHLRTPEYNQLFAGDPNWVTEAIGGCDVNGRPLVSKNSFRLLQTLYNLGPGPEPNLTILWSKHLPRPFLEFCARVSVETSTLQYENDDLMRPLYGDDYGIACCVSAMVMGRQTQFFGARCNLAKLLLYALNGGVDEITGQQVGVEMCVYPGEVLEFEAVLHRFKIQMQWLAELYVHTMNTIHLMHDRYAYERVQMALHDSRVHYFMSFGIAGLSVVADSLSAIRHARVKPIRNHKGLITDFIIEGNYPRFGNDDDRVDELAVEVVKNFTRYLRRHKTYRGAEHTLSILTITSNVMYGKHTGSTPDGRKKGEPLAPGANPLHGREENGAVAACNSVAKLPYHHARDGISFTFSIVPSALGGSQTDRVNNLLALLYGYFSQGGHHINVNVLQVEQLQEAMEHPERYPDLTIRVSGYAVHFIKLTREQQEEIITRTFYRRM